jgi:transglutaminase-like putative cysteine protease
MLLDVTHETRYVYGARVDLAQHMAHLRPREMPGQRVEQAELAIEPQPQHWTRGEDVFGNARDAFALYVPHEALRVVSRSRVRLQASRPRLRDEVAQPWEAVVQVCRFRAGGAFVAASEFAFASPFVPRIGALQNYASPSFAPGRCILASTEDLMQRIHADFTYDGNATEVHTPLAQVLEVRRGVCQDFAHLMIGALRALQIPARYVSGYLLTEPAQGKPSLVGADASHAWVSVWCPPIGWVDFDPTNAVLPSEATTHVTLAVGRDYGDVMPLRGVIRGGGEHTLQVAVGVVPVGA